MTEFHHTKAFHLHVRICLALTKSVSSVHQLLSDKQYITFTLYIFYITLVLYT